MLLLTHENTHTHAYIHTYILHYIHTCTRTCPISRQEGVKQLGGSFGAHLPDESKRSLVAKATALVEVEVAAAEVLLLDANRKYARLDSFRSPALKQRVCPWRLEMVVRLVLSHCI